MFNLVLLNSDIVDMCVGYGCWNTGQATDDGKCAVMSKRFQCFSWQYMSDIKSKLPPCQSSLEEEEFIGRNFHKYILWKTSRCQLDTLDSKYTLPL